jgi:hypothetical protein
VGYGNSGNDVSLVAGADLTTHQYKMVRFASTNLQLCGAGLKAHGILQDKPDDTEVGAVRRGGISQVVCGGDVSKGSEFTSDSAGRAVEATSGDEINGVALEAGTVGGIIPCLPMAQGGPTA